MRFLKVLLIILTTLVIVLTTTYSARVSLINKIANTQLNLIQANVTCLDFTLSNDMAIFINKLCLQSPKADIEIAKIRLQWQYFPTIEITDIHVGWAEIKGKAHLFSNSTNAANPNSLSNINQPDLSQLLSTTLQPYLKEISNVQLPMKITLDEVHYSPFSTAKKANNKQNKAPYSATLSIINNHYNFSLRDTKKTTFFKVKLTNNPVKLSLVLSSELKALKGFIDKHQLPISASFQRLINTSEISGKLDTLITYQTNIFNVDNKITAIKASFTRAGHNERFKFFGDLHFQSQLNLITNSKADLVITFTGKNAISIQPSQAQFFSMLSQAELSPEIISILQDNPLTYLTATIADNSTLSLNNNKISLSDIEISADNNKRTHQVKLANITYSQNGTNTNFNNKSANATPYALTVENFILDSQLHVKALSPITHEPVILYLTGSINNSNNHTLLNFTERSFVTLNHIVMHKTNKPKTPAHHAKKANSRKKILSLKQFTAALSGNVQLLADSSLSVDLKVKSQAAQLNIPKTLQLSTIALLSQIKGKLENIQFHSSVHADQINLGNITITGALLSPKIEVAANNLPLTDLLSLKMQLPVKVELVDGKLSYRLSGQLTDLKDIAKTPFDASITVADVSGAIDDIWLQKLNWQQEFTARFDNIVTKPTTAENLTIALIDTPTPITKVSLNLNGAFGEMLQLSASKINANTLGGSVYIPKIQWPIEQDHSVNVQLTSIDLEQVLALDKKQGIVVTGNISGQIPITFDGEKYTIDGGELHNITNGLIQVSDNPAVIELKASNSQLQLAFDALQNLHYHQLSSAVSMADDGYMLLETVIKGRNPDIDNDVNLNLNINYDLPGLLESLAITQRFEDNIIQGIQQKKE